MRMRYWINTAIFYTWFYAGVAFYKVGLPKIGGAIGCRLGRWMANMRRV